MKKFCVAFLIIAVFLSLSACTSYKALEGNWDTVELLKNGEALPVYESNIKFIIDGKNVRINGCAGVNLYKCKVEIKGNSIKAGFMENTGFMGLASEMDYENLFFTVLMKGTEFKIEKDILHIFAPAENLEIRLRKTE